MDPQALLKTAVSQIIANIGTGMAPHTATVKTAQDLNLNLNFIKRATEVVNVALTYDHFKKHAEAKDADFPIVDSEKVAQEVYRVSPAVKQASFSGLDPASVAAPITRYLFDPKFKQAYMRISAPEDHHPQLTKSALFDRAYSTLRAVSHKLAETQVKRAGHEEGCASAFAELASCFRPDPAYRVSFAAFEKRALDAHGERAVKYVELLHKTAAIDEPRADESTVPAPANCKAAALLSTLLGEAAAFCKTSEELMALAAEESELRSLRDGVHREVGHALLEVFTPTEKTAQLEDAPAAVPEQVCDDPVVLAARQKQAELDQQVCPVEEKAYLTPAQSASLPNNLKKKIIAAKRHTAPVTKIASPSLDLLGLLQKQQLPSGAAPEFRPSTGQDANLQRKLMLQHLIYTDPILSQRQPREVADAYQTLLNLAPELSLEPDVTKALLRSSVESQAIDPHTANQLIEANSNLVKQKTVQSGGGSPAKSH